MGNIEEGEKEAARLSLERKSSLCFLPKQTKRQRDGPRTKSPGILERDQ